MSTTYSVGLFIAESIFPVTPYIKVTSVNKVTGALIFVSLGITLSATLLIGYRVHSTYQLQSSRFRRSFNHIVVMIVESAVAYSVVLLFEAIIVVLPSNAVAQTPVFQAEYYMQVLLLFTSVRILHYLSFIALSYIESGYGSYHFGC